MTMSAARTLVLHAAYTDRLSYYEDWYDAFDCSQFFDVVGVNICGCDAAARLRAELVLADLVVLLHSTNGDTTTYLEPMADILADRKAPLVAFIGNEVNLPGSPISAKRNVLGRIGPDFVATQLLPEAGEYLWGDVARRGVLPLPHALNPAAFQVKKPDAERSIDIGVRAAKYLPHIGDENRNHLHNLFNQHDVAPDLRVEISAERLDRAGWAAFLNDCRGTVSSEAGSWFIERDDATIEALRAWTAKQMRGRALVIRNDSRLRRLGHRLPWRIRAMLRHFLSGGLVRHESSVTEQLPFDEVFDRFFRGRPRPDIYGKCISSRHFDAIGTGTCQILLEGRYNDILKPGRHYLPLAANYGNLEYVLESFRDPTVRARISGEALEHVLANHTYALRVEALYNVVNAC